MSHPWTPPPLSTLPDELLDKMVLAAIPPHTASEGRTTSTVADLVHMHRTQVQPSILRLIDADKITARAGWVRLELTPAEEAAERVRDELDGWDRDPDLPEPLRKLSVDLRLLLEAARGA